MHLSVEVFEEGFDTPILFACWPGMGYVALSVGKYLKEHLGGRKVAQIPSDELFQLPGISVNAGLIEPIFVPKNEFYYCQVEDKSMLVFIGEAQPVPGKEYVLAEAILDFARKHGVKKVFTAAAMPMEISHKDKPSVWTVASSSELIDLLNQYDFHPMKRGSISGMNGSLLGVGKEMGFECICLLGEIPFYTVQIENPKATKAIIEAFSILSDIRVSTEELDELSQYMENEVDEYLKAVQEKGQQLAKPKGSETLH